MAADVEFSSLEDFANRVGSILEDDLLELGLALHQETVAWLAEELPEATPVGPARQAHQLAKGEPYSQHMRDRWFVKSPGKTIVPADVGHAQIVALINDADGLSTVGNDAAHANVVNAGRTRSRSGPGTGKAIGSTKAPRGVTVPVESKFNGRQDEIRRRAIERTDRRSV